MKQGKYVTARGDKEVVIKYLLYIFFLGPPKSLRYVTKKCKGLGVNISQKPELKLGIYAN